MKRGEKITADDSFIFKELRAGDIAIDCGANIGLITKLMAETGAETHAFEPDPNAFSVLSKKFSKKENVICYNAAVSRNPGTMKLFFRKEHKQDPVKFSVGSTLISNKTDIDKGLFAQVKVVSLARFVSQFQRIRILKIDVEGAEVEVLEDLLDRGLFGRIDLMLVETHEEWIPEMKHGLKDLKDRIAKEGWRNSYFNWI